MKSTSDEIKEKKKATASEVVCQIKSQIEGGIWRPGEKLPSERYLASKYGTTRATVQYAFQKLAKDGLIVRSHGAGTFVKEADLGGLEFRRLTDHIDGGITSLVERVGGVASSIVLTKGIITGSFFTHKLQLEEDAPVYALHRVRCGNGIPVALEYTYVPAELFEDIDTVDFAANSLYQYMDSKNHMPIRFNEIIQIVEIIERERTYMALPENVPVYSCKFIGFDKDNRVVEYTEMFARCDMFELNLDSR